MAWLRKLGIFSVGGIVNGKNQLICPEAAWPDYYSQSDIDAFGNIKLGFDDAIKFFYRVKTWQIVIGAGSWEKIIESFIGPDLNNSTIFATYQESALAVTHGVYDYFFYAVQNANPPFTSAEIPFFFALSLTWSLGPQVPIVFSDNTYGIKFFSLNSSIQSSEYLGNLNFKFVIKQPNASYPEWAPKYPENFILKPLKWWPYDPGDGNGPIYNEDTGQKLRPLPD